MASRYRFLVAFFVILLSFSSCLGRFLDINARNRTHAYDHDDHGNFKDYLMARVLRFRNLEENDSTIKKESNIITSVTRIIRVYDFGAKGNSMDDTKAFEKAWVEACSSNVSVVLVKPIRFTGPCKSDNITVQIYGTIEASKDRSDYKNQHWLLFEQVQHLTVEGGGTIDGNGDIWWKHSCKVNKSLPCTEAPTALMFLLCENLVVRNLRVRNAQNMQVGFHHSNHVTASNLTVTAPANSPNTDGIHITHTQNINISNSVIATGDDCISIVSGSQTVRASDITCGPGHGISIGSLGNGNSEAHVSDVIVNRAKLSGTTNGLRIKTWQGGSGSANNIKFLKIEMKNVKNPIIIDQNYCDQKKSCAEKSSAVQVKDVLYQNITGTSASEIAIKFDCSKSFECQGIVLQDVDIRHHGHHNLKASCKSVELSDIGVVTPLRTNIIDKTNATNTTKPTITPSIEQHVLNVDDFGPKGNNNDDTEAFKKAWDEACSSNVETFLVVPQRSYLVKPIKFEGPCKSHITVQIYGTIEASDERSDYADRHWLLFDNVNDLVVEGGGTIDGNGDIWWKHSCKIDKSQPCKEAPTALTFHECEHLAVQNLTIKNAQQIQVSFDNCKNVKAHNLTVTAPGNSPNTDGIHVTHTQDIDISNCIIGTGDDCISIVSGSKHVQARDVTCGPGHGISIGSLGAKKSEAYVSDVTVNNAKFFGSSKGVRIKTWQGGSGSASNFKFTNIEMHDVDNPIIIDQNYCDKKEHCKEEDSAVEVRDVLYHNIKGTSSSDVAIKFECSESHKCQGIVLQDIDLQRTKGDSAEALCNNVDFKDTRRVLTRIYIYIYIYAFVAMYKLFFTFCLISSFIYVD